jgi:hypothetical protein
MVVVCLYRRLKQYVFTTPDIVVQQIYQPLEVILTLKVGLVQSWLWFIFRSMIDIILNISWRIPHLFITGNIYIVARASISVQDRRKSVQTPAVFNRTEPTPRVGPGNRDPRIASAPGCK